MTIKITTEMLDLFGKGHSQIAVHALRQILQNATTEPIELSIYEVVEVKELRRRAATLTATANEIEARGPWPEGQSRDGS